jgi:hypothetical protein
MLDCLWLVYERPPHPDAVSYPAREEDLQLVLEMLSATRWRRMQIAEQLGNYLREQRIRSPFQRLGVPLRRESGLYQIIPWRFAQWMSRVLTGPDALLERVRGQIEAWQQKRVRVTDGEDDSLLRIRHTL